jgi:hypothetical protein
MRPLAALLVLLVCPSCARGVGPRPAEAADVESPGPRYSCRVAGETRVVAENVYGGEAVASARAGGGLEVVLVDQVEPCLHIGLDRDWVFDGTTLGPCPAGEPSRQTTSRSGVETYLTQQFRGTDGLPHVALGYVQYDWPTKDAFGAVFPARTEDVWHRLFEEGAGPVAGERMPALATFGSDGFFLAWVEDDVVRGVPLTDGAHPATPALDLSPLDVDEIGRPSVAFRPGGKGLVTFLATTPTGRHALATPLECSRRTRTSSN